MVVFIAPCTISIVDRDSTRTQRIASTEPILEQEMYDHILLLAKRTPHIQLPYGFVTSATGIQYFSTVLKDGCLTVQYRKA